MANTISFSKSASEIARYGGRIFIAPYDATKTTADTVIGVLNVAMSTGSAEQVIMETNKSFPASGVVTIGTEDITYTARTAGGIALTCSTRLAPAAHAVGSIVTLKSATAYTISELGYFESFALNTGKKDATNIVDCNGNIPTAFTDTPEPTLKIVGLQSDIATIGMAFGVDVGSEGTDGLKRLLSTTLENYMIYIYVKQQKGNSAGYRYGLMRIHNAIVSGAIDINFSKDIQKIELGFKLLDGATAGTMYDIGQ